MSSGYPSSVVGWQCNPQSALVGIKRHGGAQGQGQIAIAVARGEVGPDRDTAFLGEVQRQVPDGFLVSAVGEGAEH